MTQSPSEQSGGLSIFKGKMNWSVTYRAKGGEQAVDVFEADSREALFKLLADKGIAAIRVQEGQVQTKRQAGARLPRPSTRAVAWACVGLLVAAGAFLVATRLGGEGGAKPSPAAPDKGNRVAKAAPETVPAPPAVQPEPEKPAKRTTAKGTPIPDNVQPDERGVMRYPNGQRWVDPNDLHIVKHPQKRKLFKRTCDNQLAIMLTLDPTKMAPFLVGKRRPYGDAFIKDFHDSLYDKYEADPDDTEEEKAVRKMVMETRAELKAAMDRGEDIAKIMNATQEELDRLCQYQDALKKELKALQYDESVPDADFEDFVKAANQMLEKQGLKGLTMPNVVTRQARIKKMKELLSRKEKTHE